MVDQSAKSLRLLYLKRILLEETDDEHGLSVNDMIQRLSDLGISVTAQTLRADIAVLRNDKMDIVMDSKGKNTTYHVGQRDISLAEQKMICDCIESNRSLSKRLSDELIEKIESFSSKHERELKKRQMFMAGIPKTDNEKIFYNVDSIYEAIFSDSPIHFFYLEWTVDKKMVRKYEGKIYEVSPWSLIYGDDCYYMVAFDHGTEMIKHYRVDKMERIDVLHESTRCGAHCFEEIDIETYSNRHFGMFGGRSEDVTIECQNYLINVVMDRFGTVPIIKKSYSDHFRVTVPVVVSKVFFGWVFEFAGDMTIIGPSDVKEEYRSMLQEHINKYTE